MATDPIEDRPSDRRRTAPLTPIPSMSRRDTAVKEIRRAIVLGALQPGERLTEGGLATSLAVSRNTVREALTLLSQEGLIVQEPYRGMRVADISYDEIMDLARTRMSLDLQAIGEILADPTGRRIELVRTAWREYDRLPMDADPDEAHEAHIAFHRSIWHASDNIFLSRLWPVTEAHLTIALARDQATRLDPRRSHDVHEQLVDAIVGGNLDEIRRSLEAHTLDSAAELVAMLQARGPRH